jgi:hypothetical protein
MQCLAYLSWTKMYEISRFLLPPDFSVCLTVRHTTICSSDNVHGFSAISRPTVQLDQFTHKLHILSPRLYYFKCGWMTGGNRHILHMSGHVDVKSIFCINHAVNIENSVQHWSAYSDHQFPFGARLKLLCLNSARCTVHNVLHIKRTYFLKVNLISSHLPIQLKLG